LLLDNIHFILTGTKLHQQTRKAISKRKPALMSAIRKFNKYCVELKALAAPLSPIPIPTPLSTELNILRDDPYLMEDVWVEPSEGMPPRWLEDSNVRKGIKALLKVDRTKEEEQRLRHESRNLLSWFGRELVAIKVALKTSASES
jgi:hypothetical protein